MRITLYSKQSSDLLHGLIVALVLAIAEYTTALEVIQLPRKATLEPFMLAHAIQKLVEQFQAGLPTTIFKSYIY